MAQDTTADRDSSSVTDLDISILSEMGETFELLMDAKHGKLSPDAQTYRFRYGGSDKAEALGHSYHLRDVIREAGRSCECEYIEPAETPDYLDQQQHWVEIRVSQADAQQ